MLQLRLANPCDMSWDSMAREPGRRTRHCASCEKSVFDLARATESEARAVIALLGGEGRICARVQLDREGDAVLRLEPRASAPEPGARPVRRLAMAAVATMAAACGGSAQAPPCVIPESKVVVEGPAESTESVDSAEVASDERERELDEATGAKRVGAARTTGEDDREGDWGLVGATEATPQPPVHTQVVTPTPTPTKRDPKDRDGDGIQNAFDACPDESGPQNSDPRFNGCPMAMPGGIGVNDATSVTAQPKFAARATTVLPDDARVLDEIAALLRESPELRRVELRGHASRGEARPGAKSAALAAARAEAVAAELVRRGVSPERLRATAAPDAREPGYAGRDGAANRRVEFAVVERGERAEDMG